MKLTGIIIGLVASLSFGFANINSPALLHCGGCEAKKECSKDKECDSKKECDKEGKEDSDCKEKCDKKDKEA